LDIQAGIYVTIVGMALVFSALTILMLAIMVLNRVFRPKEETSPGVSAERKGPEEESVIVAAMAVALSLASEEEAEAHSPRPVSVLSIRRGTSAWRNYARLQSVERGSRRPNPAGGQTQPAAKPSRRPNPAGGPIQPADQIRQKQEQGRAPFPDNMIRRQP